MKTSHAPCSHPSLGLLSGKAKSLNADKRNRGNDAKRMDGKSMESSSMARELPTASTRRNEGSKRKTDDDHRDTNNPFKSRGRTKTEGASIPSKDDGPIASDCQKVYHKASLLVKGAKALTETNKIDDAIDLFKMARDSISKLRERKKGSTQYPPELTSLEATIRANLSSLLVANPDQFDEATIERQRPTKLDFKNFTSVPSFAPDNDFDFCAQSRTKTEGASISSKDDGLVTKDCQKIYDKAKTFVEGAEAMKDINETDLAIKFYKRARDSISKLRERKKGSTQYPPELTSLEATIRANLSSLLVARPDLQIDEATTERQRPTKLDFKNCGSIPYFAPDNDFDFLC